jgi:hypothetical protein
MTSKTVKEQVAERNRSNGPRVKPEEHPHGIARPEAVSNPLHKPVLPWDMVDNSTSPWERLSDGFFASGQSGQAISPWSEAHPTASADTFTNFLAT